MKVTEKVLRSSATYIYIYVYISQLESSARALSGSPVSVRIRFELVRTAAPPSSFAWHCSRHIFVEPGFFIRAARTFACHRPIFFRHDYLFRIHNSLPFFPSLSRGPQKKKEKEIRWNKAAARENSGDEGNGGLTAAPFSDIRDLCLLEASLRRPHIFFFFGESEAMPRRWILSQSLKCEGWEKTRGRKRSRRFDRRNGSWMKARSKFFLSRFSRVNRLAVDDGSFLSQQERSYEG